jgi:hypothetical protein
MQEPCHSLSVAVRVGIKLRPAYLERYAREPVKREITWEDYDEMLWGGVVGSLPSVLTNCVKSCSSMMLIVHTVRKIMLRMTFIAGQWVNARPVPTSESEVARSKRKRCE